jgi:hypothetical protein
MSLQNAISVMVVRCGRWSSLVTVSRLVTPRDPARLQRFLRQDLRSSTEALFPGLLGGDEFVCAAKILRVCRAGRAPAVSPSAGCSTVPAQRST